MFESFIFLKITHFYWILKVVLFFLVGGYVLFGVFFHRLYHLNKTHMLILFFLMTGLSPYLATLIIYYSLYILPHQSNIFYLMIVFLMYLLIYILFHKKSTWRSLWKMLTESLNRKIHFVLISIISFLGIIFLLGWMYYISVKPITEHDTLEYATQGKVFYEQKVISYQPHRYDKHSGFYYVGLHGFSFPLLATLERMTNIFINSNDYFFRSINSIYGMLILMVFFLYSFEKTNFFYAIIMSVSLLFTYGFFETIMKYHIDHFRIFFLVSSIYVLVQFFDHIKNTSCLNVLGLFLGAQSNTHSLGFMLACILLCSLFLFLPFVLKDRMKIISYLFFLMMLYGGIHYVCDVFFGTGWIFKEVKFY